jgi:hypothetical protein
VYPAVTLAAAELALGAAALWLEIFNLGVACGALHLADITQDLPTLRRIAAHALVAAKEFGALLGLVVHRQLGRERSRVQGTGGKESDAQADDKAQDDGRHGDSPQHSFTSPSRIAGTGILARAQQRSKRRT